MADYYPLIARAVAGLEKNTGENRRTLYERARTALVAQLRGVSPALDESEITRERLALEEAIRKIEAEAVRAAREQPRTPPPPRPAPPPSAPARPAAPSRPEPPRAREPSSLRDSAPRDAVPPRDPPPRPVAPPSPARPRAPIGSSLSDEAMKGFREVASDPNAVPASPTPAAPRYSERPRVPNFATGRAAFS